MKWEASLIFHKNEYRIVVRFEKDANLISRFKNLEGRKWSKTLGAWHLPDNKQYRLQFGIEPQSIGKDAFVNIHPINQAAFQRFIDEIKLKGYSNSTLKNYMSEFAQLLYLLKSNPVESLTPERLRAYFLYCKNELKLSDNSLHSRINAIKFYFEKVQKQEKFFIDIPRPKKPNKLPKVLDTKDLKKIFTQTENLKHKTMLKLCYGMGLRVSEIVNLKISDIDSGRMQVFIERSKGKKDRYVNLPESILQEIRAYYKEYKPKLYLFEGQYGGHYSIRSVQQVFTNAMKEANINKKIGIHGLRHSYATHLLENGTDISYIQKLLGHNEIKTTLIYTHVSKKDLSKIKSPLDNL